MDYTRFNPESLAGWEKTDRKEWHGPCPFTAGSKDCFWVKPAQELIGCRACGDGSGRITSTLKEHAEHVGIWTEQNQNSTNQVWTYQHIDGSKRKQIRYPFGKRWDNQSQIKTNGLLFVDYYRGGDTFLCEGASSAEALGKLGLSTVGVPSGRQLPESLNRLKDAKRIVVWPDYDSAGWNQSNLWAAQARETLPATVAWIDPLKVCKDAKQGYDPRDFASGWNGTAAEAAAHIEGLIQAQQPDGKGWPRSEQTRSQKCDSGFGFLLPPSGSLASTTYLDLADRLTQHLDGRARYVDKSKNNLFRIFTPKNGWLDVSNDPDILTFCAEIGKDHFGKHEKNDDGTRTFQPQPLKGSSLTAARTVATFLRSKTKSDPSDWDSEPFLIAFPNGRVHDIRTGTERTLTKTDLICKTTSVVPCSLSELEKSELDALFDQLIQDDTEREWLKCVISAGAVGMDTGDVMPWLYGSAGSGKGTLVDGISSALGNLAFGVPPHELLKGGYRGHPAWKAELEGRRVLFVDDFPAGVMDPAGLKAIIGTEIIADKKGQDHRKFRFKGPLIFTSNFPPAFPAYDDGINRRLAVIKVQPYTGDRVASYREAFSKPPLQAAAVRMFLHYGRYCYLHGVPSMPESIRERTDETWRSTGLVSRQ